MGLGLNSSDSEDEGTVLSEINVTPMVDVMLVLLVIFMVTAPLINPAGVTVELPKAAAKPVKESGDALWVTIDKKGVIHVEDRALSADEFENKFRKIVEARNPKDVYIRADQTVAYGVVARTMAEVQAAGVERVGMVTEPPSRKKKGRRRGRR